MNFSEEVKTALWDLIDEMSQNKFNYLSILARILAGKRSGIFLL